ncbi:MAG: hypothetical protein DDG59_08250 [Anaerolineae bacterium]|jgi:hypothetical protein|nr:MAG: hypothetical protein DDG59_08250 [Anaerolineae bacterium]
MLVKKLMAFVMIISVGFGSLPYRTLNQTQAAQEAGFHLVQADDSGVTIEYFLGDYSFETVELDGARYDRILLQDASHIGEPGKPNLPLVATSIGVPINAEFDLQIEETQTKTLSGTYRIEPASTYMVGEEDLTAGNLIYVPDSETYASPSAYPGIQVELGEAGKLRSQRILPVRVFPFQYRPASGDLEVIQYIRFRVVFQSSDGKPLLESSSALAEEDNPFEPLYQQSLLNYQEARRYRAFEYPRNETLQLLSETASSERYKITVTEDGIYKLTYETLQAAGMPVTTVNPQTFAMTNQGRPVAIYVHNSDGDASKFSPGEYVLFFGERLDGTYLASLYADEDDFWRDNFYRSNEQTPTAFSPRFNRTMIEKYTNQNVYWLTYGGEGGPFMEQVDVTPGSAPYLESFQQRIHYEEQNVWWTTHFTSEDTFFWDNVQFTANTEKNYSLNVPNPIPEGNATLRGEFVARADSSSINPDHVQAFYINKNQHPTSIGTITWDGKRRYRFEFTFPASYLVHGPNTLTVEFKKVSGVIVDQIFVDWFEIIYERQMIAQGNQISINRPSPQAPQSSFGAYRLYLPLVLRDNMAINSFSISGFTDQPIILQISDPLKPKKVNGANFENGVCSFVLPSDLGKSLFVASPTLLTASKIEKVSFDDIVGQEADYIFIAPKAFLTTVQDLASYRQTTDGFSTTVVSLEEIINQFNFGIYHPRAIKNYLQYVYDHWTTKPSYVLLVGDGHWNFLGSSSYDNPTIYMPPNLQWVDPWQGEIDSANDLVTVDGWDPLPDIYIGRLPVTANEEILAYLYKVQVYENALNQAWQKRFLFVSDANDPSAGNFPALMDDVINDYSISDQRKVYLNKSGSTYTSYNTESDNNLPCGTPDGSNQCPNATQTLLSLINTTGVGHLVYSGHGFIDGWSKAVVFSNPKVNELNNGSPLPIVFSLDCLDGYWYYPQLTAVDHRGQSLIEILVRTPSKGAVAAFSPTGLGLATAHDKLQRGFYDYIFSGNNWRLGEAAVRAKLRVYQEANLHVDLVHTYTVFGDPALLASSP